MWLGVVVSKEWKKADFDQLRVLYRYRWCGVCICGGYGEEREGMGGRKKKHPHRVLLSDIGFCTNYNAVVTFSNRIPFYGLHLTPS